MATGTAPRPRRKPVYQEVDEREARKVANRLREGRKRRSQTLDRRYAVPYDADGPHVRLGLLWFLVALVALAVGPLPTALVYGGAAAAAAAQTARCWRRRGQRPNELVAAALAGAMGAGACLGAGGAGIALVGGVGVAGVLAFGDVRSKFSVFSDVGLTLQCAVPVGLVATSMVLLTRLDRGTALALLVLVSGYEAGDYTFGTGATAAWEGPAVGIITAVVLTPILGALPITALDFADACVLGLMAAVAAPLGQLVASAVLPSAAGPASALRRLDSLLLAAPLWCWLGGLLV